MLCMLFSGCLHVCQRVLGGYYGDPRVYQPYMDSGRTVLPLRNSRTLHPHATQWFLCSKLDQKITG